MSYLPNSCAWDKLGLTRNRVIPFSGAVSYSLFSANVLAPEVLTSVVSLKAFGKICNVLLVSSNIGIGYFLYTRPHMKCANPSYRAAYSLFGTFLFNFGSVMMCAIAKSFLKVSSILRMSMAFGISASLLMLGYHYIDYVDSQVLGHS